MTALPGSQGNQVGGRGLGFGPSVQSPQEGEMKAGLGFSCGNLQPDCQPGNQEVVRLRLQSSALLWDVGALTGRPLWGRETRCEGRGSVLLD